MAEADTQARTGNTEGGPEVSARDKLYEMVLQPIEEYSCDLGPDGEAAEANRLIDAFAHELAEQQRAWAETFGDTPTQQAMRSVMNECADQIDPYVQKEQS